ncbi:MAG: hypothetical protein ABW101_18685, partial [Candidatus Thiodiazotropha sp.]
HRGTREIRSSEGRSRVTLRCTRAALLKPPAPLIGFYAMIPSVPVHGRISFHDNNATLFTWAYSAMPS